MSNRRAIEIHENPSIKNSKVIVNQAIDSSKTLIIVGNCWVDYEGRANSRLEPGERIFLIKEDHSILVHRVKGYEPVNWQPPGCIFSIESNKEILRIRGVRRNPQESLTVSFDCIYMISTLSLVDQGEFFLYASEEDMQKAIMLKPSIIEKGLLPIASEKYIKPGFIDFLGMDEKGRTVVIEIKRNTAGRDAVLQLAKYIESLKSSTKHELRGILVAPQLARGVQTLLLSLGLEFKSLKPKKCARILKKNKIKRLVDFY